jgi:rubrerythrin
MTRPNHAASVRLADADTATKAVVALTRILVGPPMATNTYCCGMCGCLCKADEACPSCRWDLVGRKD